MENEIKVGEYVRYKDGDIIRIFQKIDREYVIEDNKDRIYTLPESAVYEDMGKHSPKLLDLIKAEDTIKIKIGLYTSFVHFIEDEDDLISIKTQIEANFWIIDKIYTKEMMESISYKVKE